MEQIRLAYQNALIGKYANNGDNEAVANQIVSDLKAIYGQNSDVRVTESDGVYTVTIPEGTYTIDENGNVSRKAGITIKQGGIAVQSVTVQIVNGVAQAETIVAEVEGLEGEIEWKIEGTEASKFQKTVVESTEGNKRISTATVTTGNETEATTEDVIIRVSCGAESASCSAKIIRVVKVTSIENITTNATNGKIDVGSNNITVTATVNEGATEELNWSVNEEYQDYVTITKSNPVINTANNTQTVTIELGSGAVGGTLRITAQNETADVTGTNYVELTVNIPVSGIKMKRTGGSTYITNSTNPPAQMPEITIAQTTGTVGLTAEIEPSTAANQAINWTITTNSGVARFNGVAGNTTTGSAVTVQAGSTEGEVTVTATSVGDTSKTVSVKIKVAKEVGHFKTVSGVAYYYPSQNATAEERIEITNNPTDVGYIGKYLGREVKYTPGNAGSASYGTSTTYRLFYIDVGGKYGDGVGTIYLKADCDTNTASMSSHIEHSSSDSRAVMKKLNPGMGTTTYNDPHDYCVAWMTDPTQWSGWKDGNIKIANENTAGSGINYVVGGPSLEMYVDSYNAYLDAHTENNVVQIYKNGSTTARAEKLDCEYTTESNYNAKGYRIGFKNTAKANWANTGYYQESNSLFAYNSANGQQMYNPGNSTNSGSNHYYWLASPSADDSGRVMYVHGGYSLVSSSYSYGSYAFCPLVSIKSGVSIEEK